MSSARVVHLVGNKHSGKTTLAAALIAAMRARGLRAGAVKHSHHAIPVDDAGTDSWRAAAAGADPVVFAGSDGALVRYSRPLEPAEAIRLASDGVDLVILEGFKGLVHLEHAYTVRLSGAPEWRATVAHPDGRVLLECAAADVEAISLTVER